MKKARSTFSAAGIESHNREILSIVEERPLTEAAESVLLKQTLTGSGAAQTVRELISHETTAQAADSQRGR